MLQFSMGPVDCVLFVLTVVGMCIVAYEQGRARELDKLVMEIDKLRAWEDELIARETVLSDAIDDVAAGTDRGPPHDYSGVEKFSD